MAVTRAKTLTNINNFYKFANLDPLAFNGAYAACIPNQSSLCGDGEIWSQYQMPLSREKLAELIFKAENDVASALGTFVKPRWVREEIEIPTNWANPDRIGRELNRLIFTTKYKYVRRFGQRLFEKILNNIEINYIDEDNDGFYESATVEIELPEGANLCDVTFYFSGTDYEIGQGELISFEDSVAIFRFDSWLLINPSIYIARSFKREDTALDACDLANYAISVDVWENKVDLCKPSIEFVYQDNHQCTNGCNENKQPGCAIILDKCEGRFKVNLQQYDEDGCVTTGQSCHVCSVPKKLVVYYESGCHSDSCYPGECNTNCFCQELEWIVFKLAASYYPEPTCDCACIVSLIKTMQQETSLYVKSENRIYSYPSWMRNEAIFGTTVGQIEAAIDLMRIREKFCSYE